MTTSSDRPHALRYAIAGAVVGLQVAVVITVLFGTENDAIWWWPAGTVVLGLGGALLGWMIDEEVLGGREEHAQELEAERLRHQADWSEGR